MDTTIKIADCKIEGQPTPIIDDASGLITSIPMTLNLTLTWDGGKPLANVRVVVDGLAFMPTASKLTDIATVKTNLLNTFPIPAGMQVNAKSGNLMPIPPPQPK